MCKCDSFIHNHNIGPNHDRRNIPFHDQRQVKVLFIEIPVWIPTLHYTAVQNQNAVPAYFSRKQLSPFGFVGHYTRMYMYLYDNRNRYLRSLCIIYTHGFLCWFQNTPKPVDPPNTAVCI